ncbi:hypothetical protein M9458_035516, partial [Cirrhinus mrigala]
MDLFDPLSHPGYLLLLQEDFAASVEWILVRNRSPFTVSSEDDLTSSTLEPEPSLPSPRIAERQPEPTADRKPEPSVTDEPLPSGATVLRIATGARAHLTRYKSRSTHCTAAEGELSQDSVDNVDIYTDMPPLLPPSFELFVCPELLSLLPQLRHHCLLAAPQHTLSLPSVGGIGTGLPVSICVVAGGSLTPPRPFDLAAPPLLLAPLSPPSPVGPPDPPDSLGHRPAIPSGLRSSSCASSLHPTSSVGLLPPSSSTLVLNHSGSAADLQISPSAPPWPSGSSSSPWLIGSPSLPQDSDPPAVPCCSIPLAL